MYIVFTVSHFQFSSNNHKLRNPAMRYDLCHGRLPSEKMECLAPSYGSYDDGNVVYPSDRIVHKEAHPLLGGIAFK